MCSLGLGFDLINKIIVNSTTKQDNFYDVEAYVKSQSKSEDDSDAGVNLIGETSSSSVVLSAALIVFDAVVSCICVDDFSMLFVLPSGGCGGFDFLLLLNHCNV